MGLRGQWCGPCQRVGHRCAAAAMGEMEDGLEEPGGSEPVCLDCLNGRPCAAFRVAGTAREESGVRAECVHNDCGLPEVAFPGVEKVVVYRTPEELGIARTVESSEQERLHEKKFAAMEQESAAAAAKRLRVESEESEEDEVISEDVRKRVVAAGYEKSARELATDFKCTENDVVYARALAKRGTAPADRKPKAQPGAGAAKVAQPAAIERIEVDTARPETAAALLGALDKLNGEAAKDAAPMTFRVELTAACVVTLLRGFSYEQQAAFVQGGLQAALGR